jgi:hypothetical protein
VLFIASVVLGMAARNPSEKLQLKWWELGITKCSRILGWTTFPIPMNYSNLNSMLLEHLDLSSPANLILKISWLKLSADDKNNWNQQIQEMESFCLKIQKYWFKYSILKLGFGRVIKCNVFVRWQTLRNLKLKYSDTFSNQITQPYKKDICAVSNLLNMPTWHNCHFFLEKENQSKVETIWLPFCFPVHHFTKLQRKFRPYKVPFILWHGYFTAWWNVSNKY